MTRTPFTFGLGAKRDPPNALLDVTSFSTQYGLAEKNLSWTALPLF